MSNPKKRFKKRYILFGGLFVLLALPLSTYIVSYAPEHEAQLSFQRATIGQGYYGYEASDTTLGVIYYPGGLVNPIAYATFAENLSQYVQVSVFVIQPLFNLAITNIQAADAVITAHPHLNRWIVGGHSLGGSTAAFFAAEHLDQVDGLFFLASYTTEQANFDGSFLPILSVVGSLDTVLDMDTYVASKRYWSQTVTEMIIEGGNHAQFGHYGPQRGDGVATIARETQQDEVLIAFQTWLTPIR
jgi:hypothetical protein